MLNYETKVRNCVSLSICLTKVCFIYQWKAYNLRILDIWVKCFFIFSRSRDLDHVTLIFSEKVENLGQFFVLK